MKNIWTKLLAMTLCALMIIAPMSGLAEEVTISAMIQSSSGILPPEENFVIDGIEAAVGFNVDIMVSATNEDYNTRKAALTAARNLPDIISLSRVELAEMVENGAVIPLGDLLEQYGQNVLADKGCTDVLPLYITFVTDPDTDDNMREIMGDVIVENANAVKEQLLATVKKAKVGRQYLIEALSNCERDERIFAILSECFRKTRHLSAYAHMLVKYGDERAVDLIKERIEEPSLRYADFTELTYAIEALGGEYDGKRDFSCTERQNQRRNKKIYC